MFFPAVIHDTGHHIHTNIPIYALTCRPAEYEKKGGLRSLDRYIENPLRTKNEAAGRGTSRLTTTIYSVVDIPIFQIGCCPSCCLSC